MRKWFENRGDNSDITVSTRVRLARNIKNIPFASRMSEENQKQVVSLFTSAIERTPAIREQFDITQIREKNTPYLLSLVERHLVSPDFAGSGRYRALMLSKDEGISIMINEEDHLRLQVFGTGLCLESCLETAVKLDTLFDEAVEYAFDEKLGYLTHCPTNLGTGMRASVMLHLPALTETGRINGVINAAGKLNIAVRGIYGEGTSATGSLYQVSNAFTLGFSEDEVVARLKDVVTRIIAEERVLRAEVRKANPTAFADKAWRAYGIMSNARQIGSHEAAELLSALRVGASAGEFPSLTIEKLNRLLSAIQPAVLTLASPGVSSAEERDRLRADLLRKELANE